MRSNSSRQSESFEKRQKRRTVIGIVAGVIALFTWIFVFVKLSSLPSLAIDTVDVYGAPSEVIPVIRQSAQESLSGKYLGLFDRANALIYPRSQIASAVMAASPIIDKVTVRTSGIHNLSISVSKKSPGAVVCADLPDLSESEVSLATDKCFMVDRQGLIFSKVGEADTQGFQIFYLPDLSLSTAVGSQATTTPTFKSIQSFIQALNDAGIEVVSTLIKENGEYEIYAHNPGVKSIVVIHATDDASLPIEQENLILFWNKMITESRTKKVQMDWDEIKLQYPPNVYYTEVKVAQEIQ